MTPTSPGHGRPWPRRCAARPRCPTSAHPRTSMCEHMFVRTEATILHADLDSFYASVEQRDDPRARGRPVDRRWRRGARRELRGEGVRHPHPDGRPPGSAAVPEPRRGVAPLLGVLRSEQGGVRGVRRHHAARRGHLDRRGVPRRRRPARASRAHRRRSRSGCGSRSLERVGLPITVGVARTKFLAKVASRVAKPDGLLVVQPDRELAFLHPLPVEALWGVGAETATKLHDRGIDTVADVARLEQSTLMSILGPRGGRHLHTLAHNYDPRPVEVGRRRRSIGSQRALGWRREGAGRDRGDPRRPRRPRDPPAARPRTASDAPSCCACGSKTRHARLARTRCRGRPRSPNRSSRPLAGCSPTCSR